MKSYIARDTGEPLVVMGGYKIAENGSIIRNPVPKEIVKPTATPADYVLLEKHGYDGLKAMQFIGVIDRLQNAQSTNPNG